MESGEKAASTCLEQLFTYLKGTVPALEQLNESTEEADQNVAATGVKSEKKKKLVPRKNPKKDKLNKRWRISYYIWRKQMRPHPCCAGNTNFRDRLVNRDRRKS